MCTHKWNACISIYIYVYTYTYTYIHLQLNIHIYIYIKISIHTQLYIIHMYIYICMYVCTYGCMYICMYICMYVCIYAYIYIETCLTTTEWGLNQHVAPMSKNIVFSASTYNSWWTTDGDYSIAHPSPKKSSGNRQSHRKVIPLKPMWRYVWKQRTPGIL